jgi:hypothetical protein
LAAFFEPGEDAANIFMSKTSKTSGNALPEVFNFWQAGPLKACRCPAHQAAKPNDSARSRAFDGRQQIG